MKYCTTACQELNFKDYLSFLSITHILRVRVGTTDVGDWASLTSWIERVGEAGGVRGKGEVRGVLACTDDARFPPLFAD